MIILNLKDGLGNQMFEYAYARALQEKYKEKLYFNMFFFNDKKRKSYSLHNFKLKEDIKILSKKREIIFTILFNLRLLFTLKKDYFFWLFSNRRPKGNKNFEKLSKDGLYVSFEPFEIYDFKKTDRRIKFIYGNFESEKYFKQILDKIKEEFVIVTPPSEDNKLLINEMSNCNSVCIHIRRGDYLDERWKMLNICNYDYYNNAIEVIKEKITNPIFYIFSNTKNDINWIKENYKFDGIIKYVELENPDYEELRLMYSCKHFIISNSTFSWWGAYLSKNPNKLIIAPDKWTNDDQNTLGIYQSDWITINI